MTGAGFPFYLGPLAQLQRALIHFFIDEANKASYVEMQAPYFINEDSARGTGQIPDKEDMMYEIPRDAFYAIPTAEVLVTNFIDEILSEEQLPLRYVCHTLAGEEKQDRMVRMTRLNRLHQFDKWNWFILLSRKNLMLP